MFLCLSPVSVVFNNNTIAVLFLQYFKKVYVHLYIFLLWLLSFLLFVGFSINLNTVGFSINLNTASSAMVLLFNSSRKRK
jgi:hypothetical protein